ncbi:hypothetical protein HY025_01710 [Candidatus Daviesbacteria bacterium]|nr:hypothetical protein [Candidatus Daviesbacteria bacterium]
MKESFLNMLRDLVSVVPAESETESYEAHLVEIQRDGQNLWHAMEDVVTAANLPHNGTHFWNAVEGLGRAEAGYDLERQTRVPQARNLVLFGSLSVPWLSKFLPVRITRVKLPADPMIHIVRVDPS